MFGYVMVHAPELKVKEYARYRAFYCGLCRELGEQYGMAGQAVLTYDMTFLVILLTSLYECEAKRGRCRCRMHPVKKRETIRSEATRYGADMNILLAYYQMKDSWKDDRSAGGAAGMAALRHKAKQAASRHPRQAAAIAKHLGKLWKLEQEGCEDLDQISGCFGQAAAQLFAWKDDQWAKPLKRMGFYLGKFIYLMDAWDDLEKDEVSGSYNPLRRMSKEPDYEMRIRGILMMMMAECSRQFERLPCLDDVEILRNILYTGVWNKMRRKEREDDERSI